MKIIGFIVILIGVILIVITMGNFRRKSELEISSNPTTELQFKIGVGLMIIGLILMLVSLA